MNEQIITTEISQTSAAVSTAAASTAADSTLAQSAAAMVFGLLVIFAVGFLPMAEAHNAAHDTRHTLAFPCH